MSLTRKEKRNLVRCARLTRRQPSLLAFFVENRAAQEVYFHDSARGAAVHYALPAHTGCEDCVVSWWLCHSAHGPSLVPYLKKATVRLIEWYVTIF